jgi:penicillin-binding protein 1A
LANGGAGVLAYGIKDISDSAGRSLYRRGGSGPGQVVAAEQVGAMNDMLAGVIGHGTGKGAALPRPAAGKTGTTQDYHDAWFIGYTADLVAGVWLGNDDNTSMNKVTGGTLPAPTWRQFMLAATAGMPVRPLPTAPLPAAQPIPLAPPTPLVPPAAATASAGGLDRLFGWIAPGVTPAAAPAAYPGLAPPRPGTILPPPRD